jgi:hypothetical protein
MNERIDFSSIDPKMNDRRWERMVDDVVRRAVAERKRKTTVLGQVTLWTRPAIAAAAAVALLCLAGIALTSSTNDGGDAASQAEPALAVSSWAAGEALPETRNILTILGDYHVDE